ncbi:MAG: DUF6680 family protein, partial [Anaerolineales bacterium]
LDYNFDKTAIKNSSYFPRGHGETEEELRLIRVGVRDLLSGSRSISVVVANSGHPASPEVESSAPTAHP